MTSGLMAVVDALSRYIFSLLQSINYVFSNINCQFLTIFVKVFYDERFLSLLALLVLNGCDDGDLIQEDINFQDIATQVAPQ
jgi:hypothetical protein